MSNRKKHGYFQHLRVHDEGGYSRTKRKESRAVTYAYCGRRMPNGPHIPTEEVTCLPCLRGMKLQEEDNRDEYEERAGNAKLAAAKIERRIQEVRSEQL